MATIETALLHERLHYDPDTGIFTHRHGKRAGLVAGCADGHRRGYIKVSVAVNGRCLQFLGHRLAWQHYYGEPPSLDIDHINGVCSDNRISNLRLADRNQQQWNYPKQKVNTSGFRGVRQCKKTGRWRADIRAYGKRKYLGSYDTPEQASEAYEKAALERSSVFYRNPANDNNPPSPAV